MARTEKRTGPDGNNVETGTDQGGNLKSASSIRPNCCTSLTLEERDTAARFAIHCDDAGRCARLVLSGGGDR